MNYGGDAILVDANYDEKEKSMVVIFRSLSKNMSDNKML